MDVEHGGGGGGSGAGHKRVHTPSGHPAIVWRGNIFGTDDDDDKRIPNLPLPPAPPPPTAKTNNNNHSHRRPRGDDRPSARTAEHPCSISSTFAAEMSSLLDSISLKSSLSSLRSGGGAGTAAGGGGGGVLGVPARLQTPLSVQKMRQDSAATTVVGVAAGGGGALLVGRGSVSSAYGGGGEQTRRPSSMLSTVPLSPGSSPPPRARGREGEGYEGKASWEHVYAREGECGEEIVVGMEAGGSV